MCTIWEGAPGYWGADPEITPANAFFTYGDPTWFRGDVAIEMVEDVELGARIGTMAFKPVEPLHIGEVLTYWDEWCEPACSYCESDCEGMMMTIGAPDVTPPTRPELTVHTRLVRDPDGVGWYTCGDADSLEIQVTAFDDMTAIGDLGAVAYIAPTVDELAAMTTPTHAMGFRWQTELPARIEIGLGEAEGHVRRGSDPFTGPDPFCFQLAVFDAAGNLSERSLPECVDTDDPDDPSVIWVESMGCGCQADGGSGLGALLLVALAGSVLRETGRGRRRCR